MTAVKTLSTITNAYTKPRPGSTPAASLPPAPDISTGLELSDIMYKPVSWLTVNPENAIFRALKSEQYFRDLQRDISEAGAILNPLIAMPDGLLLEGESRLLVAQRLEMKKVPVRLVLSPLSLDEQRRRLWLGNLSRFEVDEDTRLLLYAKIWQGYYRGDTVSSPQVSKAEIAQAIGKSERQVVRDKRIVEKAAVMAQAEDREMGVQDIQAARQERNQARRERVPTLAEKVQGVIDELYRIAEGHENGKAYRQAAMMLERILI
jgi:hypothetical protein